MSRKEITLENLKFKYDKTDALSIDTLKVQTGATTVFLGSNGSGKTTILKLLSGLIKPYEGTIKTPPEILANKAILVHQTPYLFKGSVRYNINFVLINSGIKSGKRETIIKNALNQTELLHLINRKSSSLSGGEKHRLAIARALAVNPEVLILDEPFAHIDLNSQILIEKIINRRSESGQTTIMSTHNLASAFRLADKIIHMDEGKIKEPDYNFFKGSVTKQDNHFVRFVTENKGVSILATGSDKEYKTAVIHYSDIFLSTKQIKTSAQNQLKGIITAMKKRDGQFMVTIDCGVSMNALITELSVNEFKLKTGDNIYINFKASAVKLY